MGWINEIKNAKESLPHCYFKSRKYQIVLCQAERCPGQR